MSWFSQLKQGLAKTRQNSISQIVSIFKRHGKLDDEMLVSMEEALLLADLGVDVVEEMLAGLKARVKEEKKNDLGFVMDFLRGEVVRILSQDVKPVLMNKKPWVCLVVGVNGVGKTTTIGKMAYEYKTQNKKVLVVAADTFRAAACEQLEIWAQKSGSGIIKHQEGADPSAVVFDAMSAAKARDIDIVIIDTAGRLHTKVHLMEEIKKIDRVLKKQNPEYPHETLLILDATTGQNALEQAKIFHQALHCTGVVVTKLDGTAKGGMLVSIQKTLNIPVRMIGVGEGIEDLKPFNPEDFARALFDLEE
jgi:fused signal recognition particle receptor